ncbi:MAG: TlpA family protein disulfide reductase [Alphaproteobacteria bacterium]|nr:TlpA family protein disulfide reductase [Alphaproteobacteria bacterium]MCB9927866.1 TlpA family protein disulfide reductase [Alphaproteobacteria bacterium]
MRWIALVLLVAVIAAAAALYGMVAGEGEAEAPRSVAAAPATGDRVVHAVPDWTAALQRLDPPQAASTEAFTDGDGKALSLADFKGQGVVLNLWATWCGPCVTEMPSLNRLQAAVAADGIRVVAVSSDREGMAKVGPFLKKYDLDHLQPYLDPNGAFQRSMAGQGLPRTFILNGAGQVVASYVGPAEWDAPELIVRVRELAR